MWGYPEAGSAGGGSFTSFGLFFGPPAPPPVVFGPPLVTVVEPVPPPLVVVREPERYRVGVPVVEVDPVGVEVERLTSSWHGGSREDAARVLGRLGDARAVPPLMEKLRFDRDPDVRAASAWALGEIGDPRAAEYLERATVYDKKKGVREAAEKALLRLETAEVVVEEGPVLVEGAAEMSTPAPLAGLPKGRAPVAVVGGGVSGGASAVPAPPAPGPGPEEDLGPLPGPEGPG
jgi:hypothetical protein